jgi:ferredoxin
MRIVTVRRISQAFFLGLFAWFAIVTTFGQQISQLRGWPVNWMLELDPLVGLGTILTTHKLYWLLAWGLATVALTVIFGRVFCSWICPFGTMHHFISYLGLRSQKASERVHSNKYRKSGSIKYLILLLFIVAAAVPVGKKVSLLTGLLDPIPLVSRSFNLVLLPIADSMANKIFVSERFYEQAWIIGAIFLTALGLNLVIPRFYCRFICPTGALLGIIDRFAIWRIGKNTGKCTNCKVCNQHCHGGCEPAEKIRIPECVLCFNCLDDCPTAAIEYKTSTQPGLEEINPDVSRRGLIFTGISSLVVLPMVRLGNKIGANWNHGQVRPPGALEESEFLKRCIKCGQCMRICPSNVLQPAGIEGGVEALWTPVLNNRIGSSGCQPNCTACGYICPTAAIRPITISERLGLNEFSEKGPLKIGTAFVDQARCLPWSMGKPCIVCQENCPVSPKAIFTREYFSVTRFGRNRIAEVSGPSIKFESTSFKPGELASGDYYCRPENSAADSRRVIVANTENSVIISSEKPWQEGPKPGDMVLVEVRLQRPYVDIDACIGCGICEHECPVSGLRAIRVSAEGESRSTQRKILLQR